MTAPPGIVEVDPDMKMVRSVAYMLTLITPSVYAIITTTTTATMCLLSVLVQLPLQVLQHSAATVVTVGTVNIASTVAQYSDCC
jgi:hypothetical protein